MKQGCIELLTEGSAAGRTSISVETDGTPRIIFDEAEGSQIDNWRAPLPDGALAEFFELFVDWSQATYEFYPYYWAGTERWKETAQVSAGGPVFEQFLQAGSASVMAPVRPGFERPALVFLKTGLIWGGKYMPLFNTQEMLDIYSDVEQGVQNDPPVQIGESWEIRVPTNLVILLEGDEFPKFPSTEDAVETDASETDIPETEEPAPF